MRLELEEASSVSVAICAIALARLICRRQGEVEMEPHKAVTKLLNAPVTVRVIMGTRWEENISQGDNMWQPALMNGVGAASS
jgi:hypothetical protein